MKKGKIIIPIIFGIVLISIFNVSAISELTLNKMSFLDRISYYAQTGFFTSWGQAQCCAVDEAGNTPDGKFVGFIEGQVDPSQTVSCSQYCSYNKCAIDVFDSNWKFLGEYTSGSYKNSGTVTRLFQVYCCPSNPTCSSGSHKTTVYRCVSGSWQKLSSTYGPSDSCSYAGSANGNLCYCASTSDNFYIDQYKSVHCRPSSYSSVTDGSWCPSGGSGGTGGTGGGVNIPANKKNIGDSCANDLECISAHCDSTGWFGLGGNKCSPTPWSEVKKVAATRDEISQMTTSEALAIACLNGDECLGLNDSDSVDCVPIQKLINDGTLSFDKTTFFEKSQELVGKSAMGAALGGLGGIALCAVSSTATAVTGGISAPAAVAICSAAISGGALIGAAAGYSTVSFSEKDPITSKLKSGDSNAVGLCVKQTSGLGNFSKYTSWAAFFKITGDKGVDGLIIIFGLFLMLLLLLRK